MAPCSGRYSEGAAAVNGGLTLRDPVTGAQYVQIQLLQVRPPDICLFLNYTRGLHYHLMLKEI